VRFEHRNEQRVAEFSVHTPAELQAIMDNIEARDVG
jgi:hypothetical protein